MARLKEEDIRRIIREEFDSRRERDEKLASISPDARKTWERMQGSAIPCKTGVRIDGMNPLSDVDWPLVVEKVLATYWEVAEEELNE